MIVVPSKAQTAFPVMAVRLLCEARRAWLSGDRAPRKGRARDILHVLAGPFLSSFTSLDCACCGVVVSEIEWAAMINL